MAAPPRSAANVLEASVTIMHQADARSKQKHRRLLNAQANKTQTRRLELISHIEELHQQAARFNEEITALQSEVKQAQDEKASLEKERDESAKRCASAKYWLKDEKGKVSMLKQNIALYEVLLKASKEDLEVARIEEAKATQRSKECVALKAFLAEVTSNTATMAQTSMSVRQGLERDESNAQKLQERHDKLVAFATSLQDKFGERGDPDDARGRA